MSKVVSDTVTTLPSGGSRRIIEWEDGGRAEFILMSDMPLVNTQDSARPRYQPGNAGYQRAMRIIDAKFDDGRITAKQATQMEEDYITESDRAEG